MTRPRAWCVRAGVVGVQGGFHAVGVGGAEAVVEGECLVQAGDALAGLSLVQVAVSEVECSRFY